MYRYCASCNVIVPANEYRAHVESHRPGSTTAWRKLREVILARDDHACTLCGSTYDLEVHHKDGDWRNNALTNLEVRCRRHNRHGPVAAI